MTDSKKITQISKFLSLVLRHQPGLIGIELDPNGWTDVAILIEKANAYGIVFDRALLAHVVDTNAKKRFAFNDAADKIRANQGHSVEVELGYAAQVPPEILFHGTGEASVPLISTNGLDKRDRHHVHLSSDPDTARQVGQRHGKPFVFTVLAAQMHHDGFEFFLSDNGVWLTDSVPAKYLDISEK